MSFWLIYKNIDMYFPCPKYIWIKKNVFINFTKCPLLINSIYILKKKLKFIDKNNFQGLVICEFYRNSTTDSNFEIIYESDLHHSSFFITNGLTFSEHFYFDRFCIFIYFCIFSGWVAVTRVSATFSAGWI